MNSGEKLSKALGALQEFKNNRQVFRTTGNPVFINTGRLVEMDADGEVMEVYVYEGDKLAQHLFVDHQAIQSLDSNVGRHQYQLDDRSGGKITRCLTITESESYVSAYSGVVLDSVEKDDDKWKQVGGTSKGGVFLTHEEWNKVKEYSKVWHEYYLAFSEHHKKENS